MSIESDVRSMSERELNGGLNVSVAFWCVTALASLGMYIWLFYISVGAGLIAVVLSFVAGMREAAVTVMREIQGEIKRRRGGGNAQT